MIGRSGIGEIQPANCQMTAADVAAIVMIRNNAVWIHGLIKHCLQSWTGVSICLTSIQVKTTAT